MVSEPTAKVHQARERHQRRYRGNGSCSRALRGEKRYVPVGPLQSQDDLRISGNSPADTRPPDLRCNEVRQRNPAAFIEALPLTNSPGRRHEMVACRRSPTCFGICDHDLDVDLSIGDRRRRNLQRDSKLSGLILSNIDDQSVVSTGRHTRTAHGCSGQTRHGDGKAPRGALVEEAHRIVVPNAASESRTKTGLRSCSTFIPMVLLVASE